MKRAFNLQMLKMLGAAAVIGAAFFIMMPGLVTYLFYLGKILTYIAIVLIGAAILTFIYAKYARINRRANSPAGPVATDQTEVAQHAQSRDENESD